MTLQQFIDHHTITFTATRTDRNPDMSDFEGGHYQIDLERLVPGRNHTAPSKLSLYFSKGYGHKGTPPTVIEVLECLQNDARTAEDCASFEDFCDYFGYDSDSRKAEKTYKAVQRQIDKLRRFLGADLFTELLQTEED